MLQDQQLLGGPCQIFAAVFREDDHVLNPHPQLPGEIDPRLRGDHRPRREGSVIGGGGPGLLVDLHAHAVAEAVAEILFVSGVTVSYTVRISSVTDPTATVRVISEQ